jgi:hypothetical protein
MNWMVLVSGLLAAFCAIGHLIIGIRSYLRPMTGASFDVIPKKVMHAMFHYITVDFILAAVVLLAAGLGLSLAWDLTPVVFFVGLHFILYAIVQLIIALTSKIQGAPLKIFQWTLFLLTGVFAVIGSV